MASKQGEVLNDIFLLGFTKTIQPSDGLLLGTELGFQDSDLKRFEKDYQGDSHRQIYQMLIAWRKRTAGDGLSKVRQLGEALANDRVGLAELRDKLFLEYGISDSKPDKKDAEGSSPDTSGEPALDELYMDALSRKIKPKNRYPLGLQLRFKGAELDTYSDDYRANVQLQIYHMLVDWLNNEKGDVRSKVKKLADCLGNKSVGRSDLSQELLKDFNIND
ncbi:uncharacterized protein LOC110986534 [Acanthaster planci]|uniref:Uncharacterized protein LOC110986534 n=1 Tax=Acanthaster planci TaxID=133434 RepID=A0A8B7ZH15_ACAPL|nr:uncharacterized protein LOC110986534 [Acanthaster planci]